MTYGIFILRNGAWALHGTFANRSSADQELAYLTGSLGVTAKLFRKN